MHRLRVPRPEPGRRRAAPAQHAPQHKHKSGTTSTAPQRRGSLRHSQPSQPLREFGHQAWDDIQLKNELKFLMGHFKHKTFFL